MKSKLVLGLLFFAMASAMSCSKEQNQSPALSGSWKVSSLVIGGVDKSQEVAAYSITFDDHGMMSVHDSMNTYICGWQENSDMMHSGMMDSMMHDYHFDMMGCPDDSPMQMLDADWVMDNQSNHSCSFHEKNVVTNILVLEKL